MYMNLSFPVERYNCTRLLFEVYNVVPHYTTIIMATVEPAVIVVLGYFSCKQFGMSGARCRCVYSWQNTKHIS